MSFEESLDTASTPWIWFDLDDTLWDFRRNSIDALREFYEVHGLSRLWPDEDSWIDSYHAVNTGLWERYSRGEIDESFLRMERFRMPLTEAGVPDDEARRLSAFFDTDYLERLACRSGLVAGARELLDRLHGRGFRLGILSNGFADTQRKKLKVSGIAHYFSHVVLSEEAGAPKPSVAIFRYAERICGAGAHECVMIGDNPSTDIAGALAAGWRACLISDILGI